MGESISREDQLVLENLQLQNVILQLQNRLQTYEMRERYGLKPGDSVAPNGVIVRAPVEKPVEEAASAS